MSYDSWKTAGPPDPVFGVCRICHDSEEDHAEVPGIGTVCPDFLERAWVISELLPYDVELEFESADNGEMWYLAMTILAEIEETGLYIEEDGS